MSTKLDQQREWSVVGHKQVLPNGYIMKWNEGMLKQCINVGSFYHEWIDHPKLRRVRMFDSDYIEAASFTPWWIVPTIYIPWSLLELELSHYDFTSNPENIERQSIIIESIRSYTNIPFIFISISLYFIGILLWTLFEYFVHKHGFHWDPPNPAWNLTHFVGHGMHHLTPTDKYRLVFPPAISFTLGLIFRFIFYKILFPFGIRSAIYGGFMVGYALYESIHYLAHHCPVGNYLQQRFIHHSQHHFNPKKQDKLYGVSTQIWDVVFGTYA